MNKKSKKPKLKNLKNLKDFAIYRGKMSVKISSLCSSK